MDFDELIMKRAACKLFTGEKISKEQVQKIKNSIRFAPSSLNLQPWMVKIVDDKDVLAKLNEFTGGDHVKTCSHLFLFCAKKDLYENKDKLINLLESKFGSDDNTSNFDKVIDQYLGRLIGEQEVVQYGSLQIYMALENAWLAATNLGLAACAMGSFQAEKYREILSIPNDLELVIPLVVGFEAQEPREKTRFEEKDVFF